MPVGARNLSGVKNFVIEGGGFDDYGRIYVNNYLVNTSENHNNIFVRGYQETDVGKLFLRQFPARIRNNEIPVPKDVRNFLRSGANFIVYELINATRACSSRLNMSVNGITLETFPQFFPTEGFSPDRDNVLDAGQRKSGTSLAKSLNDALCSRWIYEFF